MNIEEVITQHYNQKIRPIIEKQQSGLDLYEEKEEKNIEYIERGQKIASWIVPSTFASAFCFLLFVTIMDSMGKKFLMDYLVLLF